MKEAEEIYVLPTMNADFRNSIHSPYFCIKPESPINVLFDSRAQ